MYRLGGWGGLGPRQFSKSPLGGSDIMRWPRAYAADRSTARSAAQCTKHQRSTMCLLPGLMLYWCLTCRRCVFFHVMDNAESPRCHCAAPSSSLRSLLP